MLSPQPASASTRSRRVPRDQGLAIGRLAELAAVLALDPDRVPALPHQRGVAHHQRRVRPAHQPVAGLHQLLLQRARGPGRGRDEVGPLPGVAGCPRAAIGSTLSRSPGRIRPLR